MKTVKQQWLILNHEQPLIESLKSISFSSKQNPGFELREINQSFLLTRYIERIESHEVIESPFGGTEEVRSVRYIYFDFEVIRLSEDIALLKLIKPPITLRNFTQTLMQALSHNASIEKVRFDLGKLYAAISEDSEVNRLVVSKVSASRVPVSTDSTARLEITSTSDALKALRSTYSDPNIKLDKISMSLRLKHETEILEISSAGSICCTPGIEKFLRSNMIYSK